MADPVSPALVDALARIEGVFVRTHEPLAVHTPLRCGGPAEVWALVQDDAALALALAAARKAKQRWWVCWPFHPVLVRDGGMRGLVIRPGRGFEGAVLLPPDEQGPARLRLGSATPWAAARVALDRARRFAAFTDVARGPLAVVADWPGCPGGLLQSGEPALLRGLCHALTWREGRGARRTVQVDGDAPPSCPKAAVTLSVEIPLIGPPATRRSKSRSKPGRGLGPTHPPPGGLFADDGPLAAAPQLAATGLLGTRLRSWRLSAVEPGTMVNTGGGDCNSALVLARSAADLARRRRGVVLDIRLPLVGFDGPPTRHRKT